MRKHTGQGVGVVPVHRKPLAAGLWVCPGLRAAGAGAAGLWLAGTALAQTQDILPAFKWIGRERYLNQVGANAHDEGRDIVYWNEDPLGDDDHWVYATGFVTELNSDNGSVKGTRFATYKYDGAANGTSGDLNPTNTAYFPPAGTGISQGDTYKAVAMAVDAAGNIFVVGEGPSTAGGANNQDYWVVKYDKDLSPVWTGTGIGVGRQYDGGEGNDIPADIIVFNPGGPEDAVVVTGTSPGEGTGLDIATVAWYASDGDRAADEPNAGDYWPDLGDGDGVRRCNNDEVDGDDRAVELAPAVQAEVSEDDQEEQDGGQDSIQIILDVMVLGTSDGGASGDDFTLHFQRTDGLVWDPRFDLGSNDVATGLSQQGAFYYGAGYSEIADSFDCGEGGENLLTYPIDYSVVKVVNLLSDAYDQEWYHTWDYDGGDDFSADIETQDTGTYRHIWITGEGKSGTRRDVFTVHYEDDTTGSVAADWEHGFNAGGTSPFNYGKGMYLQSNGSPKAPYIAGAVGSTGGDWMLTLKYKVNPSAPPEYIKQWNKLYSIDGFDEGRAVVVQQVDGTATNFSTFVVGTSTASGNGRDFCVWRYRE